jgi:hypothetical protein
MQAYGKYRKLAVGQELKLHAGAAVKDRNGADIASQLDRLAVQPASIMFTPAAGAANVCDVVIAVKNAAGTTIAKTFILDVWLSDATTGAGLTGTTASGTVQAKSASGVDLQAVTAKKHLRVQTLATGLYTLEITDTAKSLFKICAILPSSGEVQVSAALTAANYGS